MVIMATLLAAIAIVETGDAKHPNGNPAKVGRAGERSEYQITRAVWKQHTKKPFNARNAKDEDLVRFVAVSHIQFVMGKRALYLMRERDQVKLIAATWNAGAGYCHYHNYKFNTFSSPIRDYAERVVNTYEQLRREGK